MLRKFTTHHGSYLEKHRKGNHDQNISYPRIFHACEYQSNWQQSVKAHFRIVHMGETKHLFPCQECNYQGGSEKAVSYHYDARHTDKNRAVNMRNVLMGPSGSPVLIFMVGLGMAKAKL